MRCRTGRPARWWRPRAWARSGPAPGRVGDLAAAGTDLGLLQVGRVAAFLAVQHGVFAVGSRDHELVAGLSADRPALGLDGQIVQAATVEDPAVGGVHLFVAAVERVHGAVEAVGVLHQELAGPQHAEAGTLLVAELGLDLVERDRQLPVAGDVAGDHLRDHFLVGRTQGHLHLAALAADAELDQHLAEGRHAAGLLPKVDRRQRRHVQLDGAGGVHFLADDLLGLAQGAVAQREVRVGPGHHLADQSGPQHQDVAGDLRPFGRFFHRGNERLGPAHGSVASGEG